MSTSVKLHILNANGSLDKLEPKIKNAFHEALDLLPDNFMRQGVDIVFQDLPNWTIPELGIVGHTYSAHLIHLSLDSGAEINEKDLLSTLVHELHHAARWNQASFTTTLGDLLVSEGLACCFEEELCGSPPIYATAATPPQAVKEISKELRNKSFDRTKWFYGSDPGVPRWFGYAYGYSVCKRYMQKHDKTAAELVNVSGSKILAD